MGEKMRKLENILNSLKIKTCQNLRDALKTLFKWKCISLNTYIRKIKLYLKLMI